MSIGTIHLRFLAIAVAAAMALGSPMFPPSVDAAKLDQTGNVIHITVKGTVPDTVQRLKQIVASNDMMIMGELHQGRTLSMTGLSVQSESIFVGSPAVGKKLFTAESGVGVVVPVRINIYRDAQDRTVVSYVSPSALLAAFGNPEVTEIATKLDAKLQTLLGRLAE